MNFSKKVACGEFVKRQTRESGYSHFEGTWEELEAITNFNFKWGHMFEEGALFTNLVVPEYKCIVPGYRDGVVVMNFFDPTGFYSAVVDLNENSKLNANFAPRREGEAPFIRVSAKAKKQPAKHASVVLYRWDVLEENNERETDAEWEIVAIKARTSDEEEPMDPYTMARNFLHLTGGTKGDFTAEQFARSILYWSNHCMTTSKPKCYRKIIDWLK